MQRYCALWALIYISFRINISYLQKRSFEFKIFTFRHHIICCSILYQPIVFLLLAMSVKKYRIHENDLDIHIRFD